MLVRQPMFGQWLATVRITPTFRVIDRFLTRESPESVAPPTSYITHIGGYDQPSHFENYWPAVDRHAQSYDPDFLSRNVSFANMASSTAVLTPISGKSLFHFENQDLEYLPITNSAARLLGGKSERVIY